MLYMGNDVVYGRRRMHRWTNHNGMVVGVLVEIQNVAVL